MGLAISVIVPSYRRTTDLARCLDALASQLRPADEICGVAQRVDQETVDLFRTYSAKIPQLRLILVEKTGLLHALNQGIAQSTGDIVVLTDDDAEADSDWLKRIEGWFLKDPKIGAVGGRDRLQYPGYPHLSDPPFASMVGRVTWYGRMYGNHHCPTREPMDVDVLKGVNMAFRRTALDPAGFGHTLRGRGTQIGTEWEVCMYAKAKGFRVIFDSDVSVKHYASKRAAGEERTKVEDYEGEAARDICFNAGFNAGKWFSPLQIVGSFVLGFFIGSRRMPGVLAVAKYCMLGEFSVIRRFTIQVPATLAGYLTGIRNRSSRPKP